MDASCKGYAAVLYLCVADGNIFTCRLLASKTRVAPLKSVSIPRLELMGAYFLGQLTNHYVNLLHTHFKLSAIFLWTNSTIVLDWINTTSYLLKTFVENGVSQILD